jgi:hypothetical protein
LISDGNGAKGVRTVHSPAVNDLLSTKADYPLVFGSPVENVRAKLELLDDAALFGSAKVTDRAMADACRAALWLRFDFMDESHEISQEIHTPTGSFWHAILHRREPDWSNAKYWFQRVGQHAIADDLARAASVVAREAALDAKSQWLIAGGQWDPLRFVDLCQDAHHAGGTLAELCRRVQMVEWRLLFDDCYRCATKSSESAR